ncbi:MAG: hypothetical protein GY856_17790, partial [bacterium]|nr:hypothetical protein [bacterium]
MPLQILLSYAHSDDQALAEGRPGWVSHLGDALRFRLGQLLGEEPTIWDAPRSSDDSAGERLSARTLLIPILSPRYVACERCAGELREFAGTFENSAAGRIFKIVKSPISQAQQPAMLREILGYEFFATDPETGETRELGPYAGGVTDRRYWAQVEDLACDVFQTVERPGSGARAGGETIYLAETTSDLREGRELIRRELRQRGYRVLPERPLPAAAAELEAQVREELAGCRLSIHPVGRSYGEVPEGAVESLVALQNELAIERGAEGGFSRLIWMPQGLKTVDERQRQLIDRMYRDSRIEVGSDLLETSLEPLKGAIFAALAAARGRPHEPSRDVGSEQQLPCVFLVCDQRDAAAIEPLRSHLASRGFEVFRPSFEGDEGEVRLDLESKLRLCDAVLVWWGAGSERWLDGKLLE